MASFFTPNVGLEEPNSGDYPGTWDLPINNNLSALDLMIGGVANVTIASTTTTLSSSQYLCKTIIISGVLTGNTDLVFPSSISKSYEIYNLVSNPQTFQVVLRSATGGLRTLGAPPADIIEVYYNSAGTNAGFTPKGHRVGSLLEHCGSSVPAWISLSSPAPYLNCDGTAFSSATYPMLSTYLGGATLPDLRGVARATLNQGTSRITSSSGVDGNTNLSRGGVQGTTLLTGNLPPYTPTGNLGISPTFSQNFSAYQVVGGPGANLLDTTGASGQTGITTQTISGNFFGNAQGGASVPISRMSPTTVCGITMIRAA